MPQEDKKTPHFMEQHPTNTGGSQRVRAETAELRKRISSSVLQPAKTSTVNTTKEETRRTLKNLEEPQRTSKNLTTVIATAMLSVLFAAALFFQCYASPAAAIPRSKSDAAGVFSTEQEALSSLLLAEDPAAVEPSMGVAGDDDRQRRSGEGPRVIVMLADAAMLRSLRELDRGLSLYKQHPQRARGEWGSLPTLDRRVEQQQGPGLGLGPEPSLGLLKRDTMRCMVGRVYRPCWDA
ncbi:hypothetical protein CRUP_034856 [Coryphaenoides rupestris]|nr:hypothetical protein CRUP_034856 [Coryphaenoides rupestris]